MATDNQRRALGIVWDEMATCYPTYETESGAVAGFVKRNPYPSKAAIDALLPMAFYAQHGDTLYTACRTLYADIVDRRAVQGHMLALHTAKGAALLWAAYHILCSWSPLAGHVVTRAYAVNTKSCVEAVVASRRPDRSV